MSAHREMEKSSAMTNPGSELERRKTKIKQILKYRIIAKAEQSCVLIMFRCKGGRSVKQDETVIYTSHFKALGCVLYLF